MWGWVGAWMGQSVGSQAGLAAYLLQVAQLRHTAGSPSGGSSTKAQRRTRRDNCL